MLQMVLDLKATAGLILMPPQHFGRYVHVYVYTSIGIQQVIVLRAHITCWP